MGTVSALSALRRTLQTTVPYSDARFYVLKGPLTVVRAITKIDEGAGDE
jgi:hypothetical protein